MIVCESCTQENPADYSFCYRCGKALSTAGVQPKPAIESTSAVTHSIPPQSRRGVQIRKCPFCAEEIAAEAKKCKHCGEYVDDTQSATAPFSGTLKGLSPYYQDEFQKMQTSGEQYRGKWNWAAFFFGGFWAISKGLWKPGLVSIAGGFLTAGLVAILYWFVFGARGNYMYYSKVVKRQEPWI
jgi:hypothetical protein